jgi:hypothetical protein
MAQRGIDEEHYAWYRDLERYATVPHAGFGLGFECTLAYVTGLANVRDTLPIPRTPATRGIVQQTGRADRVAMHGRLAVRPDAAVFRPEPDSLAEPAVFELSFPHSRSCDYSAGRRLGLGSRPPFDQRCQPVARDAARSSSVTSSTLSTAGIRRGCGTTVSRRDRSGRSSVTVKKKRKAETALLMLRGCMPIRVWCS